MIELSAMVASVLITNGGGQLQHIGLIMEAMDYTTISGGSDFITPVNPSPYPTLAPGTDNATICKLEAEHKAEITEFETFLSVSHAIRSNIIKAVDPEWIQPLKNANIGFTRIGPLALLDYLQDNGAQLD
jgi:hypothetical protein